MSNEKKKEEEPPTPPPPTIPQPDSRVVQDLVQSIAKANEAADRLAAENDRQAELLARQEALVVAQKLGGKADAGTAPPTEEEEEKARVDALLAGTGYEGTI